MMAANPSIRTGSPVIKILPGGYHADPRDVTLTTTLGSCVSCCLHDPGLGIGGMNHFMLPEGGAESNGSARYGIHAMELLINALLQLGARRDKLTAKIFGGGAVLRGMTAMDVGKRNVHFVEDFLRLEKFRCWPATCLTCTRARWPFTPIPARCSSSLFRSPPANRPWPKKPATARNW